MQANNIFDAQSENEDKAIRLLERLTAQMEELSLLNRFQALGADKVLEFIHSDKKIRFFLPYALKDFIQRVILKTHSFYENLDLEKFRHLIPTQATIIDAGANIGNHSVFFSVICGAKKIYAFEPMAQTFEILQRNVQLNAPECIECINAALGASQGRAAISAYRDHNFGAAAVRSDDRGAYAVTTIDSLNLPALDFIKIDVEGSQLAVLKGAEATLKKYAPLIWIELHSNEIAPAKLALEQLGYTSAEALSRTNFLFRNIKFR